MKLYQKNVIGTLHTRRTLLVTVHQIFFCQILIVLCFKLINWVLKLLKKKNYMQK